MSHKSKSAAESSDRTKLSTQDARRLFDLHVTPSLEAAISRLAPFLARGNIDFSEACGTVMAIAIRRGAYLMPPDDINTIHHWVMDEFVRATGGEG